MNQYVPDIPFCQIMLSGAKTGQDALAYCGTGLFRTMSQNLFDNSYQE
ncbi:hypothetical protein [Dialister succinatiphilus]|nr:hypothetical protein [Dialister succinatiphilus]